MTGGGTGSSAPGLIVEGVVTTIDARGGVNIAPMGPIVEGDFRRLLLRPYRTSRTYRNLLQVPEGVFHVTDDVDLIARAAVGDPRPPLRAAAAVRGWIIEGACRCYEFRAGDLDDREERTSIRAEVVARASLRDFLGFNRAKHAVVEAAILASRIGLLPIEEILREFDRLEVLVRKTGGPQEMGAFAFLRAHAAARTTESSAPGAGARVRTGSRLHFGLIAPWPGLGRRHGGAGMMIEQPGIDLAAAPAERDSASGPLAERSLEILESLRRTPLPGMPPAAGAGGLPGLRLEIRSAAPEHAGLGTGTQLALAIARAAAEISGRGEISAADLARWAGRGKRSAIGIHGFSSGGLLVDGGHSSPSAAGPAPLIARHQVPEEWGVLLALPRRLAGLSGAGETEAFRRLEEAGMAAPERAARSAAICRAILLSLLPSLAERDYRGAAAALGELQRRAGEIFSGVQGGIFASPQAEAMVAFLRAEGLEGAGQSSWGPAVFALCADRDRALLTAARLAGRFGLEPGETVITRALNTGALVQPLMG